MHWKELDYETVIRKVTARANAIARKYTVLWIQVCTYQKRLRSTNRSVHMICYRASKAKHRPQTIQSQVQTITSDSQWANALQNVFAQRKHQKLLGLNMDAYNSIQQQARNSLANDALDIGGDVVGGIGSALQMFGGNFNFMTEPRMFSVFFRRKSRA